LLLREMTGRLHIVTQDQGKIVRRSVAGKGVLA
jgi:hypothetical protein